MCGSQVNTEGLFVNGLPGIASYTIGVLAVECAHAAAVLRGCQSRESMTMTEALEVSAALSWVAEVSALALPEIAEGRGCALSSISRLRDGYAEALHFGA